MTNKGQLLQDPFLNILRKEHIPVSIYLVNGINSAATKLQNKFYTRSKFQLNQ